MIYTVTLNPAVDRELTIDAFEYNTVLRSQNSNVDVGGKGFNVSRMLASLGEKSIVLGFVGGKSGELLRDGLHTVGIETDFVWVESETRTNVVIINKTHDTYLKVNESGSPIHNSKIVALIEKVTSLAKAGDWWVLAGSLPPNVPRNIFATLTEIIQSAGGFVILDTSGDALAFGCDASPYLIKPNDHELLGLTKADSIEDGAKDLFGRGVTNIVVSQGKKGALLLNDTQSTLFHSPTIEEKNPIGAGDSMVGGIVYGLHNGLSIEESIQWGIACGAATASKEGTTVGTKEDVERLRQQIM